jgi:ATP phosphoribosyltransferase regulatory subunit
MSFYSVLQSDEKAIYNLRELYRKHGYSHYKVSKFEEYDFYAGNKNFLVSENILTFTDTDGRLMALKPDVTLSIIKNADDSETHKVYYNETVYRTSASADGFREIMQTGLECIGNIDVYAMSEVITLAQKSLDIISDNNILDVSHMGFVLGLIDNLGVDGVCADELIGYIGHKNIPAIKAFCASHGIFEAECNDLCKVTSLYAPIKDALSTIARMVRGEKMRDAYEQLSGVCSLLDALCDTSKIYLDFSTVNDMNYYNGITFRGFIKGIPDGVLSGGRYDTLLHKMGKTSGAIGFAVYLDMLERLADNSCEFDVDTVLLYSDKTDAKVLAQAIGEIRESGVTLRVERGDKTALRCKKLLKLSEEGVITVEAND